MILLDKPYVSLFLQESARRMDIPVYNSSNDIDLITLPELKTLSEEEFIATARTRSPLLIYSNSENSLAWIYRNMEYAGIPNKIELFKDKVAFRKLVQKIYPNFFFKEIPWAELNQVDAGMLKKPFIIKPAVGFFSMGVYKVNTGNDWEYVKELITDEMTKSKGLYPAEVVNSSRFIIEEYIEGNEYAIDAYYDAHGTPVILNIFEHPFSSEGDVSDRVYLTSKKIISKYLGKFTDVLDAIGKATKISNFPVHMEVRVDKNENVLPIEVNPMRFAGWCTTDLAYYAYGINVYEHYFLQTKPDWEKILKIDDNQLFCLVVANIPNNINLDEIKGIDYESYAALFSNLIVLRKIDYRRYPVFAFSFISTTSQSDEVGKILNCDLSQFIKL